jgi:hypothetical protein
MAINLPAKLEEVMMRFICLESALGLRNYDNCVIIGAFVFVLVFCFSTSTSLGQTLPDLELQSIEVTPNPPIYADETIVQIRVTFKNIGNAPANSRFFLRVLLNGTQEIFDSSWYYFEAGQSVTQSVWNGVLSGPSQYIVNAEIDADNEIAESNENNNTLNKIFDVLSPKDNQPPPVPDLQSPDNGAELTDDTPRLEWERATDPEGNGYAFECQVATNVRFTNIIRVMSGDNRFDCTVSPALAPGRYYWRVRSHDMIPNYSSWSLSRYFDIISTFQPLQLIESSCYVDPSSQDRGGKISIWYQINNPNSYSVPTALGCSIRPSAGGQWISDSANDETISVAPGEHSFWRDFDIPVSISELGTYTVWYAIRDGGISGTAFDEFQRNDLEVTEPVEPPDDVHLPPMTSYSGCYAFSITRELYGEEWLAEALAERIVQVGATWAYVNIIDPIIVPIVSQDNPLIKKISGLLSLFLQTAEDVSEDDDPVAVIPITANDTILNSEIIAGLTLEYDQYTALVLLDFASAGEDSGIYDTFKDDVHSGLWLRAENQYGAGNGYGSIELLSEDELRQLDTSQSYILVPKEAFRASNIPGWLELGEDSVIPLYDNPNLFIKVFLEAEYDYKNTDRGETVAVVLGPPVDRLPTLNVDHVSTLEGDDDITELIFTVTLSKPITQTVTVSYTTFTGDGSATEGDDYMKASGELTFYPRDIIQTITVKVIGDPDPEDDETFGVVLSDPSNARYSNIFDRYAVGTILDDDSGLPKLSINDFTASEGDDGITNFIFTISLSEPSNEQVSVFYYTSDITATHSEDYEEASLDLHQIIFEPSFNIQTITIPVYGDIENESNETFTVRLYNPFNATLADGVGMGTIIDDDAPVPKMTLGAVSAQEGDSGYTDFVFEATLSEPTSLTITGYYSTVDGSATSPDDYIAKSGTLTFPAGETHQQIIVQVKGDTDFEEDETFGFDLRDFYGSGYLDVMELLKWLNGAATILNDDPNDVPAYPAIVPKMSLGAVSAQEGDSGYTDFVFEATLSEPTSLTVTGYYSTVDGSATSPDDYIAKSGTLTFPAGETHQQIIVQVKGDTDFEGDETFGFDLRDFYGSGYLDVLELLKWLNGAATILNDD